jgi:hypothetical protein
MTDDHIDLDADMNDPPPASPGLIDLATERQRRFPAPKVVPIGVVMPAEGSERVACSHESVLVDEKKRELECAVCGAVVDPFWLLHKFSLKERQFSWASETALKEQKVLREVIEKLKKTKASLSSSISRDSHVKRITELEQVVGDAAHVIRYWKFAYERAVVQLEKNDIKPPKLPDPVIRRRSRFVTEAVREITTLRDVDQKDGDR